MKKELLDNFILVQSDLFTPLTRTPWAGKKIVENYKKNLHPEAEGKKVGEAWEFSCDPKFSSKIKNTEYTFEKLFETFKEDALSKQQYAKWGASSHILVKLLNADEPLSVQVHPDDSDADLKQDECGKPESWLVLDSEPGAGIYIGFEKSISKKELEALLRDGDKAKSALKFVPVEAGDYFEIEPGVTHAIGPGVTLLEPQRIIKGQSGKTYRLWDWGRKYDANGKRDQIKGKARQLHISEGMKIIDPETHCGDAFVAKTKVSPKVKDISDVTISEFPSNPYYQTFLFESKKDSSLNLSLENGYGVLIGLDGDMDAAASEQEKVHICKGQTAFMSAQICKSTIDFKENAKLAIIIPEGAKLGIRA